MSGKDSKSRDFDHLIEQNSTELTFLSAYGGLASDTADSAGIFSAVKRFLSAGGVEFYEAGDKLDLELATLRLLIMASRSTSRAGHYH